MSTSTTSSMSMGITPTTHISSSNSGDSTNISSIIIILIIVIGCLIIIAGLFGLVAICRKLRDQLSGHTNSGANVSTNAIQEQNRHAAPIAHNHSVHHKSDGLPRLR